MTKSNMRATWPLEEYCKAPLLLCRLYFTLLLSQRNLSCLNPSHQHSFHCWQVLCSLAFQITDKRGANSPTKQGEQMEGATCVIFITYVSVMKKGSFLLVSTFKKVSWLVRSKKVLQAVHLLWIFPNGQNQKYQIVRNQSLPVLWKVCIFAIPVHIPWTDLRIFLPLLPWSVCGSGS